MSLARAMALCFVALCLSARSAHAGVINFEAVGTLQDGATLSGNVVIDTTAGVVQSLNFTVTSPLSFTVTQFDSGLSFQGTQSYGIAGDNGLPHPEVFLAVIGTTLVGYTGGGICTVGSPCTGGADVSFATDPGGTSSSFTSGSLTEIPEPSSLALMGGAMLGLAAWRRRRSAR